MFNALFCFQCVLLRKTRQLVIWPFRSPDSLLDEKCNKWDFNQILSFFPFTESSEGHIIFTIPFYVLLQTHTHAKSPEPSARLVASWQLVWICLAGSNRGDLQYYPLLTQSQPRVLGKRWGARSLVPAHVHWLKGQSRLTPHQGAVTEFWSGDNAVTAQGNKRQHWN